MEMGDGMETRGEAGGKVGSKEPRSFRDTRFVEMEHLKTTIATDHYAPRFCWRFQTVRGRQP